MIRRPPRSTRTDTLFPYTTLFRSAHGGIADAVCADIARADPELSRAERRGAELAVQPHRIVRANFGAEAAGRAVAAVGGRARRRHRHDAADRLAAPGQAVRSARSEGRRVGKECVRTVRSGWSPYP